jgi:hypothetical protein
LTIVFQFVFCGVIKAAFISLGDGKSGSSAASVAGAAMWMMMTPRRGRALQRSAENWY